jgi:hypothetical protein
MESLKSYFYYDPNTDVRKMTPTEIKQINANLKLHYRRQTSRIAESIFKYEVDQSLTLSLEEIRDIF